MITENLSASPRADRKDASHAALSRPSVLFSHRSSIRIPEIVPNKGVDVFILPEFHARPPAFLPVSAEERIEARKAAKKAKDFAQADAIREELAAKGILIEDTREGTKWKKA